MCRISYPSRRYGTKCPCVFCYCRGFKIPKFCYFNYCMQKDLKPSAGLLTILAVISRFLPHPPNFTAVGGTALFGGSKLSRPLNYLLPIGIMLVTDYFLGFHKTMIYVYVSFMIAVFLGEKVLKGNPSVAKIGAISLTGSVIFFLITNFGSWQVGGLYPHTAAGLMESYVMGLPFLKWTVLGDMVYTVGFFKVYQLVENRKFLTAFDKTVNGWLS